MSRAGTQPDRGKAGQSARCRSGRAAPNTEQRFRGSRASNYKVSGFTIENHVPLLYLQELALQEAANYMSHLHLSIPLRQSTFQSHAQNVSKIVPSQKCKCIHFLSEQIKTKYHTGTTPRFPPPRGIRLTDLVHVVRLNICSSTKLPLRGRSKKHKKKLFLVFFFSNLVRAKILDFGDGGNKSIDMFQQGRVFKLEF